MMRGQYTVRRTDDGEYIVHSIGDCNFEYIVMYSSDLSLKEGWQLVCFYDDSRFCGDGGRTQWALLNGNKVVEVFESCHCGRGCGNGDCVRDDWGRHDCAPEIEAVRID